MTCRRPIGGAWLTAIALVVTTPAWGQSDVPSIPLVVAAGSPLRIALDRRVIVKRVGQAVTGTLLEPVYAYDRVVVPAGTKAVGHVETLVAASGRVRTRAILGGDFTPPRRVLLQFDTLVMNEGRELSIRTAAAVGSENVTLRVADAPDAEGSGGRARQEMARQAKRAVSTVTAPGKMERLRDLSLRALPYHPTFVPKGTVYSATLMEPLSFGEGIPTERAPEGTAPMPDTILTVRLLTALDSSTASPGTRVEAVLTQPVFASDRRLLLPEGTTLTGEVTFVRQARRFRRNGRLRFLFQAVQAPERGPEALKASLFSVESAEAAIDDEGGATIKNSNTRFVAPGLAALALAGSLHGRVDYDTDGMGPETQYGGWASGSVGGFLGASVTGVVLSMTGRAVTVGLSIAGVARTFYSTVLGKGRDVTFAANSAMQLQLSPGPSPRQ